MKRVAVVLCNLGGPDSLKAVAPFLRNLFADPAIIRLPQPFRWMLGNWIAFRRAPAAREIYTKIGGSSPLLAQTREQAAAVEARLNGRNAETTYKCFVCMRYWTPTAPETVREVLAWKPDQVIVLPLYPQYSTTTTGSSLEQWEKEAAAAGLTCPHVGICCYPTLSGWVHAVAATLEEALDGAPDPDNLRVVFSAHGLPKSIIEAGDPYQAQVEATADAVIEALRRPALDWLIAYQSQVGPQAWIGPSTLEVIDAAGAEGRGLLVVPIAFVSEHSETLVELDMDYRAHANAVGVPWYWRTPTVGCHPHFIGGLADMVELAEHMECGKGEWCYTGDGCRRRCNAENGICAMGW